MNVITHLVVSMTMLLGKLQEHAAWRKTKKSQIKQNKQLRKTLCGLGKSKMNNLSDIKDGSLLLLKTECPCAGKTGNKIESLADLISLRRELSIKSNQEANNELRSQNRLLKWNLLTCQIF